MINPVALLVCFSLMMFIALVKALCLVWCKKLDIPSKAKPIAFDAMPPNIAPMNLLFLLPEVGKIKPISFSKIL